MTIGIDGRALQFRSWGGVRHYTFELLRALFTCDRENEYHVFYNAWKRIEVPDFSEFQNVTVHYSRWPNKFFNLSIRIFHRPGFSIASGALDVLFVPNLNFVACLSPTKLVAVVHDLSFEHFPEYFSWRFRLWHRALDPRSLFRRADHLIAVSTHTKGDLVETYGIAPEKVTVVYPGIDQVSGVRCQVSELKPKTWNLSPRSYILYFGALEPRKNIIGIIEAYEKLRPYQQLVIAGLSTPYVKKLKARIRKSKLRDKIMLIENPTEDEKAKLYGGAHVFVYPSFYEGFGFPPLEAMAAGVPVVTSSAGSVPEICGDAAILVSPWNVGEIKAGMEVLLEDNEVRARYIAAGRTRVAQFSWDKSAREVFEVLKSVV